MDIKDLVNQGKEMAKDAAKEKTAEVAKKMDAKIGEDKPGLIDLLMGKALSRKLLVFSTATALLVWAGLDSDIWGMIAMCYIGGQSAIDFAKVWKG